MFQFKSDVHQFNFAGQQKTASKMYEITGEERFLQWTVWSMQHQVFFGHAGSKLLQSAECLFEKHIASDDLRETESLNAYISILEHQEKYDTALAILSGQLGTVLFEHDRLRIKGRLLARGRNYAVAAEIFKKLFESCPDDWECFLDYLACLLEEDSRWASRTVVNQIQPANPVDCKLSNLSKEEVFRSRLANALSFVKRLLPRTAAQHTRYIYLSIVTIETKRRLCKGEDKLMEAFLTYFRSFGHNPGFISDVESSLRILTIEEEWEVMLCLDDVQYPAIFHVNWSKCLVNLFKIQEWFGMRLSEDSLEKSILNKIGTYLWNLTLSKELSCLDTIPNDELLCMASTSLVQLYWRTRQLRYFVEAVMVLEFGLTIRRHFWQYKLLLLHLYTYFTAIPLAYEWCKSLDMKDIQWEKFAHHLLPPMLLSPFWVNSEELLKDYFSFMEDRFKELEDQISVAICQRNFSQVVDITRMKDQLEHSHCYLIARLESPMLQLKQKANDIGEVEAFLVSLNSGNQVLELSSDERLKTLTFADDIQSRPWWSPTPFMDYLGVPFDECVIRRQREDSARQEAIQYMEAHVKKAIQRRSLVPRFIHLSICCAPTILNRNLETPMLEYYVDLKDMLERYAEMLGHSFSDAVDIIDKIASGKTNIGQALSLRADIYYWLNFAIFLTAWRMGALHVHDSLINTARMIDEVVWLELLVLTQPIIETPGYVLNALVRIVSEPLAWHTLIIQSCVRSILNKNDTELISTILASIQQLRLSLQRVVTFLEKEMNQHEAEKSDTILNLLQRPGCIEGPSKVFHWLQFSASMEREYTDIGSFRLSESLWAWDAADVARDLVNAQTKTLKELRQICTSKTVLLQALENQIQSSLLEDDEDPLNDAAFQSYNYLNL